MASRRFPAARFALLSAFAVLTGCKEEEPRPPAAGDGTASPLPSGVNTVPEGGTNDGGTLDGGDGGLCTSIPITGLVIDRLGRNEDLPASTGGTITDGRYDLTDYAVFVGLGGIGGPTGVNAQASIVVTAGRIEEAIKFGGNTPGTEQRTLASYTATGSSLSLANICPDNGGTNQIQFNASDTQIVLRDTISKEAFTFTKR